MNNLVYISHKQPKTQSAHFEEQFQIRKIEKKTFIKKGTCEINYLSFEHAECLHKKNNLWGKKTAECLPKERGLWRQKELQNIFINKKN